MLEIQCRARQSLPHGAYTERARQIENTYTDEWTVYFQIVL